MALIYWCLLKVFHWITLVSQTKKHPCHLLTVAHIFHAVSYSFLSDHNKQDVNKKDAHSKRIIELLEEKN